MNQQLINFTEQAEPNLALFAMIRGAKNYELTNHLGNVLTTISDKKIAVCTNGVFSHYMADVLTATDYSAFGAPLPQRVFNYKENLNKVLVTQNQFNTATELNDWTATNGTRTFTNNSLQYSTTNSTASVSRNFATQTSKTYRLTFTIDIGTAGTISLAVLGYNGAAIVNGSIGQSGMQQLDFVANSTTTTLRLTINTGSGTRTLYLDNVKLEEVNGDLGGYRFGFNGMEQDDETYGEGNAYDFGARIYDARLGRWFAVDPKTDMMPWMSPYSYGFDNPIYYIDFGGEIPWPVKRWRNAGWNTKYGWWHEQREKHLHQGVDINSDLGKNNDLGAPVYSTHQGKVVDLKVYSDHDGSSGTYVIIQSPDGSFQTVYMHLNSVNVVIGQDVKEGQEIGTVGGSGSGEQSHHKVHLHYEIRKKQSNGKFKSIDPEEGRRNSGYLVDPQKWIDESKKPWSMSNDKGWSIPWKPYITDFGKPSFTSNITVGKSTPTVKTKKVEFKEIQPIKADKIHN